MTREEVYEKLTGIFRDVFNDDALLISDRTTAAPHNSIAIPLYSYF